ncbi:MAG: cache domain-containing protein, partial [Deltaproteobacteria bacterium]|nr:cache domain-containing protein [Deltaproteobacteria bacterium]
MEPKPRLFKLFILLLSAVSLTSIAMMAILWINFELTRFSIDSKQISSEYYNSIENSISLETNRICEYLDSHTSTNQVKFYLNIKNRVLEIFNMLKSLESDDSEHFKTPAGRRAVLAILSHLSYNGGRGDYICLYLDDFDLSKAIEEGRPAPGVIKEAFGEESMGLNFEPESLTKALESVKNISEGFYNIQTVGKDDNGTLETPITYLKYFEPWNLVVGASEFYANFESELSRELLGWADNVPLPREDNLLILDYDGKVLSFSDPSLVGQNVFEDDNGTLLMEAAAKAIRGAKSQGKGLIRFEVRNPMEDMTMDCVAYFRAVPSWRWVVVNWVDSGELGQALNQRQELHREQLRKQIYRVLAITVVMLALTVGVSAYISKKAGRSLSAFFNFFEHASSGSIEMDPKAQSFAEFSRLAEAANSMIRERHRAERQLTESELKFRTIFEVSPQLILVMDAAGNLLETNDQFEYYSNQPKSQALGRPLKEVLTMGSSAWKTLLTNLSSDNLVKGQEIVVSGPDGRNVYFLFFAKLIRLMDQTLVLAVGVNITSLRLAEIEKAELREKLARSQKMEAMGLMAASVAHELNNILSGLTGYPELLLKDDNLTFSQKSQIREIMDAGSRASAVVSDLLTLS